MVVRWRLESALLRDYLLAAVGGSEFSTSAEIAFDSNRPAYWLLYGAGESAPVKLGSGLTVYYRKQTGSYRQVFMKTSTDEGATWSAATRLTVEPVDGYQIQATVDGSTASVFWSRNDAAACSITAPRPTFRPGPRPSQLALVDPARTAPSRSLSLTSSPRPAKGGPVTRRLDRRTPSERHRACVLYSGVPGLLRNSSFRRRAVNEPRT